jgi:nitroreductase
MEFAEILRTRRMIRHFTDDPVDDEAVQRIVRAGLRAPSAGYSQGYALIVLRSPEERERMWGIHRVHEEGERGGWPPDVRAKIVKAPLVVAVLTSKDVYLDRYSEADKGWTDRDEGRWPVPYWYVDAGCVAMLLLLAAIDEGLGAILFGIMPADIPAFKKEFGVPDQFDVVGFVAVGHPDPNVPKRDLRARRRPDLVHFGRW